MNEGGFSGDHFAGFLTTQTAEVAGSGDDDTIRVLAAVWRPVICRTRPLGDLQAVWPGVIPRSCCRCITVLTRAIRFFTEAPCVS